ncbi:MAG: hypothetical protein RJA49_1566 [Actinomycetota bacterium]
MTPMTWWRKIIAEFVGTALLVLVVAGLDVVGDRDPEQIDRVAKSIGGGLVIAALILVLGPISGAHFNPVVTVAFAVRGAMRWSVVPLYVAAQAIGGILGAAVVRAVFGDVLAQGASIPSVGTTAASALEAVLTALLLLVVLMSAHEHSLIGTEAAFAVGGVVAAAGLVAGEVTGGSLNPARSFGPALVAGHFRDQWIFLAGPAAGGVLALGLVELMLPRRNSDERAAAQGRAAE